MEKPNTKTIIKAVAVLAAVGLTALGVEIFPEELEPIISLIVSLF